MKAGKSQKGKGTLGDKDDKKNAAKQKDLLFCVCKEHEKFVHPGEPTVHANLECPFIKPNRVQ